MEMTRRSFIYSAAGIAFVSRVQSATIDLLIKGGRVVDTSQNLSGVRDIAITGNRIARIAENIPESAGVRAVLDARGKIVTPGLADIHVHVYDAVVRTSVNPDVASVARGATTAVDAGSAGANTFPGFRKHIIERSATRVYALLNISRNINRPVYDLATTLSKFLYLGMALDDVIRCGATTPASVFRFPEKIGTLQEGAIADVAVFMLDVGQFEFTDSAGQKRIGRQKLTHSATVRSGKIYKT